MPGKKNYFFLDEVHYLYSKIFPNRSCKYFLKYLLFFLSVHSGKIQAYKEWQLRKKMDTSEIEEKQERGQGSNVVDAIKHG